LSVYPNPVKGNVLQYEISVPAGNYALKMVNAAGIPVLARSYQHPGGTVVNVLPLITNLPAGVYHLLLYFKKLTGNFKIF